jgi:hypothetical protein
MKEKTYKILKKGSAIRGEGYNDVYRPQKEAGRKEAV